jgi:flagellar hook-basal body complex protein FliE
MTMPGVAGAGAASTLAGQATPSTASSPFADLMSDAVGQVNQLEEQAHTAVTGLMAGSGVDVHQAMIATEKANMAFELALSVRNKAVQAYQSVMSMQF